MREKSRTRIEHPDLPDELKTATGEMAVAIWSAAQTLAHGSLASYRSEAQAELLEAKAALAAANADRDAAHLAVEEANRGFP